MHSAEEERPEELENVPAGQGGRAVVVPEGQKWPGGQGRGEAVLEGQ